MESTYQSKRGRTERLRQMVRELTGYEERKVAEKEDIEHIDSTLVSQY